MTDLIWPAVLAWLAIGVLFAASYTGWARQSITGHSVIDTIGAVLFGPIFLVGLAIWKLRR